MAIVRDTVEVLPQGQSQIRACRIAAQEDVRVAVHTKMSPCVERLVELRRMLASGRQTVIDCCYIDKLVSLVSRTMNTNYTHTAYLSPRTWTAFGLMSSP